MSSKNVNDQIDQLTKSIISNKKNSNSIVDLLKHANSDKSQICIKSLNSLTNIFSVYLKDKRFTILTESELELYEKNKKQLNADEKYRQWMHLRYCDLKKMMIEYLSQTEKTPKLVLIKVACLDNLFELIKCETIETEGEAENEEKKYVLPLEFLQSIWNVLLTNEIEDKLMKRLKHYLGFNDIRYFSLKYFIMDFYGQNKINELCLDNLLNIFAGMPGLEKNKPKPAVTKQPVIEESSNGKENFDLSEDAEAALTASLIESEKTASAEEAASSQIELFLLKPESLTKNSKVTDQDVHRKLFNDSMVNFLKNKISPNLYKKLLIKLPEKILTKMTNPLMLADFLTFATIAVA